MTQKQDTTGSDKRKNLTKGATAIIADARSDITIPFYSDVLQPVDDTLITRGDGKGLALYDEIERDTHAGAVLKKRKAILVGRDWEVQPGGDDPRDHDAADFVKAQLDRLPFDRICEDLLDATLKGFAISEIVWERDGKAIQPHLVLSHDQRRFVFDLDWKPRLLTRTDMSRGIELPDRKFIVHRYGVKGNNPYGLGLGSSLFWPVLFKRQGVAFWVTFLDKFASPTVVGKVPIGMTDSEQNKFVQKLSRVRQNSALALPMDSMVDLLEASRGGTASYAEWCRYWDNQMSIRTLGETLTTDIGKNGSKAASTTHHDILELLVDSDAALLATTLHGTLLRWLVDYNVPGAKVPWVWRVRAADELKDARVKTEATNAARAEEEALRQVVATSARFEQDDDARAYIRTFASADIDDDMLERLVRARSAFAASLQTGDPDTDRTQPPKKKLLTQPENDLTAGFANHDMDLADLIDEAASSVADLDQSRLDGIRKVLSDAGDFGNAEQRLLKLTASWTADDYAAQLEPALKLSALEGREAVLREMGDDRVRLADDDSFSQPFKEQIEFLEQKEPRPSRQWTDVWKGDHDRAFVVAGARDRDMVTDFQNAILKAAKDGTTLETFRKDFDRIVKTYGWSYNGERGWRTRVIFETNMRTSYMAGRLKQMRDPAVIKMRPYWQYVHAETRNPKIPRRQHLAWDGLILMHDDPFWSTHFPPNGWGCSCGIRTLSRRDLDRLGKSAPDQSPDILKKPQIDRKTGQLIEVPQGIDQGWDYQPGDLWSRGFVPSEVEKLSVSSPFTVDQAMPIEDLLKTAKPFKAKRLPDDKTGTYYVKRFMKSFGLKMGDTYLFEDKAGGRIVISDDLFRNARGELKTFKRGHGINAELLAEAIKDPDEVWLGIAERAVPDNQGGGTERVLDRKYIRVDPDTGLLVIFDFVKDQWSGTTAFQPLKKKSVKTDVNQINKRRRGILLYSRTTAK